VYLKHLICRWVRTGDEVEYDTEGNIYIVDRLKVIWHSRGRILDADYPRL